MVGRKGKRGEKVNEFALKRVETAPESCQGILAKAYDGEASPRAAIKAFCLQCVGYKREDVTNCQAAACPLHFYRPYQADIRERG